MSLYSRIKGSSEFENKIPVHAFAALISEVGRPNSGITLEFIGDTFELSVEDRAALQQMYINATIIGDRGLWKDVLYLIEAGIYDEAKALSRFGLGG